MRVLGIDPGFATIGLGLIETQKNSMKAIDWCTITTKPGLPFASRLAELAKDLQSYIDEHEPDLAVVEKIFFSNNQQTAIGVAHGRGVVLSLLGQGNIDVLEPTPNELKLAIAGDGRADKKQMQAMVMRHLKLTELPQPDDAADALGLALFGAFQHKGS